MLMDLEIPVSFKAITFIAAGCWFSTDCSCQFPVVYAGLLCFLMICYWNTPNYRISIRFDGDCYLFQEILIKKYKTWCRFPSASFSTYAHISPEAWAQQSTIDLSCTQKKRAPPSGMPNSNPSFQHTPTRSKMSFLNFPFSDLYLKDMTGLLSF